jgi:hypothetical protein
MTRVALIPQLTVAALLPDVMLARPRQKIDRHIAAARRTTRSQVRILSPLLKKVALTGQTVDPHGSTVFDW